MKENSKDREPKSLEIKFGMVFANWYKNKCTLHVVIDTCHNDWFETSEIVKRKGVIVTSIPGTDSPDHVHLILGQMTKEQILEGFDNLFEESTSKIIVDEINKNAAKPPRTIYF